MKKFIVSLLVVLMVFASVSVFAEEAENGVYDIPVYLKNFHEDEKSMGDKAVRDILRAEVKDGEVTYTLYTSGMSFSGMEGRLTNLFIVNDAGEKKEAIKEDVNLGEKNTKNEGETFFDEAFIFTCKNDMKTEYNVAIWVDVMDIIRSGGDAKNYTPGAGEQKAKLEIDWSKAKKVSEPEKEKPMVKPNDMTEEHWAYKAVTFVMTEGYFKGDLEGNFMAENSISRGDFLTVLGRIANVDKAEFPTSEYKDVEEGQYYTPYVAWATKNKLYHNENKTKFCPKKALTREEMAYILNEYIKLAGLELKTVEVKPFSDEAKISSWAKESVENLVRLDVIHGSNGMFDPEGTFTRAQVAQVLYNIYHK